MYASVFCLYVAMLSFHCSSCQAYFSSVDDISSIKSIPHQNQTQISPTSYTLVFSDNDEYHRFFNSQNSTNFDPLDKYLFAFYLPIIEIITNQSMSSVPSEFSIENLLYANLRIERLIHEYIGLKERSKLILDGLDVPYLTSNSGLAYDNQRHKLTVADKLMHVSSNISLLAGPTFLSHKNTDRIDHYNTGLNESSHESEPLYSLRKPQNHIANSGININPSLGDINRIHIETDKSSPSDDPSFIIGAHDRVPFIERFGRSLLDYIKENKTESIVYLIILFGFYYLLIGFRKR